MYELEAHTIDLSRARINEEYAVKNGSFLRLIDYTNVAANLTIRFDSTSRSPILLHMGDTFRFKDGEIFKKIFLTNAAVVGTATLSLSDKVEMERPLRITSDLLQSALLTQAITITDVAQRIPAGALTDRINFILVNLPTNAEPFYWGNAAVTAANGVPVYPGGNLALNVSESVGVFVITAAGITVFTRLGEGA